MSQIAIFVVLILATSVCYCSPTANAKDFIYIGQSEPIGLSTKASRYYLSNEIDERDISDARVGCHDGWQFGELVSLETEAEHQTVRRLLSTNGITDATRVWTTGQHAGAPGWIWYNYASGSLVPIEDVDTKPWVGGVVPDNGCISIGGRDLTYRWESHDCSLKRRYLCEAPVLA